MSCVRRSRKKGRGFEFEKKVVIWREARREVVTSLSLRVVPRIGCVMGMGMDYIDKKASRSRGKVGREAFHW